MPSGRPSNVDAGQPTGLNRAPLRPRPRRLLRPSNTGPGVPAAARPGDRTQLRAELADLTAELKQLQGENPLMQVCVDSQAIAEVVSGWTGIPVGRMVTDEIRTVLTLKERMEERIVGQSHALDAIAQRIRTSRANLTDPRRPIGVFLLVGPSGVGKTETAITLAELLYGGDQNMTVINMSEFKEEHKVSLLMGSPPGYVGYGEGGVLTEAVRRRPYSVVLLDEMEKAHPGVQDIFYQVFDKGTLRDGEGRDIDFKNTAHHDDLERRHRLDHEALRRPRNAARPGRPGRSAAPGFAENLQAGVPRPRDAGAVLSAGRRRDAADRRLQLGRIAPPREGEPSGARSSTTPIWWPASPAAAPKSQAARGTSTTSSPARCCPKCPPNSSPAWPKGRRFNR